MSNIGKSVATLGLMLPLALAAPHLALAAGAVAGTTAYTVLTMSIITAGGLLLNTALASATTDKPHTESQVYSWNPVTTQQAGGILPRMYGRTRRHPNVIACYTEEVNTAVVKPDWLWDILDVLFGRPAPATKTSITKSKHKLNILIDFGEGPIEGLVADSILINDRALSNYGDVAYEVTRGLLDQSALSKFVTTPIEYPLAIKVTDAGGAETYTTPDSDFDDLEIVVEAPRGLYHLDPDGSTDTHSVGVKVEVAVAGSGSWTTLVDAGLVGRSFYAIRQTYRASGTYEGGAPVTITQGTRYDIRVTKTTEDLDEQKFGDQVNIYAIREILSDAFSYPGRVVMQISALATDELSGDINVSAEFDGAIVSAYNTSTQTWQLGFSNNNADVILDILLQPVISGDGDGTPYAIEEYRGLDSTDPITSTFATLADYADALVDDGEGGTEARLTFDGFFDTEMTVADAVEVVTAVSRCGLNWRGKRPYLWLDTARTPVGILSDGNCVARSRREAPIPAKDRINEIEIRFRDINADYDLTPLLVRNESIGSGRRTTLQLNGVTQQSRAVRLMNFELKRNELIGRLQTVNGDIDPMLFELGDVVYAQRTGRSWGGRITQVVGRKVGLDRVVTASGGDRLIVMVYDRSAETFTCESHAVSRVAGSWVTIAGAFTIAPSVDDVYLFGPDDIQTDTFEIFGIDRTDHLQHRLTLKQYVAALYDSDDTAPSVVTDQGLSAARSQPRSAITPPTLEEIHRQYPESQVLLQRSYNQPMVSGVTFSGDAVDTVTWASGTVIFQATYYYIRADAVGTTDQFIYFDADAADPTYLQHSNTRPTGSSQWILAENNDGVVTLVYGTRTVETGTDAVKRDGSVAMTGPFLLKDNLRLYPDSDNVVHLQRHQGGTWEDLQAWGSASSSSASSSSSSSSGGA